MPYLKRINSLPLINHISYKYAQVSDIGPSWSSCFSHCPLLIFSWNFCQGHNFQTLNTIILKFQTNRTYYGEVHCTKTVTLPSLFFLFFYFFLLPFLAHLSTTCSRGAFRVVMCSFIMRRQQFL